VEADALLGGILAFAASALLTPPIARLARRVGAVDQAPARGLGQGDTPLLGGLAILVGVLLGAIVLLPLSDQMQGIMAGAIVIALVGAIDDKFDIPPQWKLSGQIAAALVAVLAGVTIERVTLPFIGPLDFGNFGDVITVVGLVAVMNIVNLSDGVDGLAAGVCAISAAAFAVIAFDLGRDQAAVLAAIVCGAALGFLVHNFHPASVFMGDSGSNLLGFLLGCVVVEGSLKTNALIALIGPLLILAVPFLDTGFVVAKRIKYRRPVYQGDANHFHHRFARIGFSQRRTVLYLYAWTISMAGLGVALRFVPYSERSGALNAGWALVMAGIFGLAAVATVYLVWVLEILKLRRLREWQLRRADPDTTEHDIEERLERDLETGEFHTLSDDRA
jgi:UDP-GlcNAc:undecaprenyl-phosphate/decaprenyl-phosphate GlcNAc-1-phosphate transferase